MCCSKYENNKQKALNAMNAVRTLYARCVRTVCAHCSGSNKSVNTLLGPVAVILIHIALSFSKIAIATTVWCTMYHGDYICTDTIHVMFFF